MELELVNADDLQSAAVLKSQIKVRKENECIVCLTLFEVLSTN